MEEIEKMLEELSQIFGNIRKNTNDLKEMVISGQLKNENNCVTKESGNYIFIWRGI